jgi:hypothetical protein
MIKKGILKLLGVTILFAVVSAVTVYVISCSKDEEGAEYWTVTLEDHYAPYQYDLEDMNMLPKSIFGMRDNGESLLFSENEIKGFSYEEGYVYVLRIKATPTLQQVGTCNPPPYTFELVEVISKKQPKIGPAI